MHLKKLELTGFKSFADRTVVDLSTGLNAIVGPNGSGKSNIADALRWVLGEQSAKQLRGGKMEDVIFAGTAHRRPLGYAEIIMRIDNTKGELPLDFKEIAVARRVYRSGESEYAINGEPCRLKDIQMLFMDTGVGRDGYSIIGQGRIDEILSLRSEDRRMVFEEAAGIGKFKSRRNETLVKLERERQNRARVDDIVLDLETQLIPLETQATEARRYLTLRDQYKDAHINIFLLEISKIEAELASMVATIENNTAQCNQVQNLLQEARNASIGLKNHAAQIDQDYRRGSEALLEITAAIEKTEGDINLLDSQLTQQAQERTRIKTEIEKRETNITTKANQYNEAVQVYNTMDTQLSALKENLAQHQKLSAQLEDELRGSTALLEAHNQKILDALTALSESRAAITNAETTYTNLEEKKEALDEATEDNQIAIEAEIQHQQQTEDALSTSQKNLARATQSLEAYTAAYNQLRTETQEMEDKLRHAREALSVATSKHRAIADLEAQYEGFHHSVKTVLLKRNTDPDYSGVCGAVGELIGVPPEYEIAIETALGGASQYIVTRNEADAKRAINMLKETKKGRATFLPLSAIKGKTMNTATIAKEPGYIGIAAHLVTCEDIYQPVTAQQLGDVIVMDTMDNALALNKKYKYQYKIVTLGGERLSPGGAITGGGTNRQTSGIIGRARQLEALAQTVKDLEAVATTLSLEEESVRAKQKATEETLVNGKEQAQTLKFEVEALSNKLAGIQNTLADLEAKAATYHMDNDHIMEQIAQANLNIRQTKEAHRNQEANVETARNNLELCQAQLKQHRQEQTEESDTLTELKIEISRRTERIGETTRTMERLKQEESTLAEERRILLAEMTASEAATTQTQQNRQESAASLTSLKARITSIKQGINTAEQEREKLEAAITTAEADERAHATSVTLLEREQARLDMRKEQLDSNSHRLHNEIWEEYGLTYQQAIPFKKAEMSETELRATTQALKGELSTLKNVNIGAIEAYDHVKTRYDFLTAQREDILQAESALVALIQNLTAQMEAQFASHFQLISQHFEEVFRQMFSGGKASLKLVDTSNVLESGIEITAQPPGKALQNLMLLSGGERALTAIALLFAILRLKPSPFCVLDEIESALDDANVDRYAKYLREYAHGTQFIIITHRKGTMEAAEHLYGVTMEEQGISKLVSAKLE